MKKNLISIIAVMFLFLLATTNAFGSEVQYNDPEGVRVNFKPDGTLKSIVASAEVELAFGDREDIIEAKREARLIAKAEIAKFLKEKITTTETLNKMTKTVIKKTSGQNPTATREKIKIQTLNIHNSADALLKGVVTLLEDINRDQSYVKVEVGMNEKTMRAADSLRRKINQDLSNSNNNGSASNNNLPGREIRKSKMYDDFE